MSKEPALKISISWSMLVLIIVTVGVLHVLGY